MKKKKIQLLALAIICVVFILALFQSGFMNGYNLQAKETESGETSESKNNKLMQPYLTDDPTTGRDKLLSGHSKAINLEDPTKTSLESKYSFIPRWTSDTIVKTTDFALVSAPDEGFAGNTYYYSPDDAIANKRSKLTYTKVGLFKGKWIDMRITVEKMDLADGFNNRNTYPGLLIGGSSGYFNQVRLTRAKNHTQERLYPNVELKYEYLEHGTEKKIEVTGYNVFADVDYRESILLNEEQMNLQDIIVPQGTLLSYKMTDGLLHIMPTIPGVNAPDGEAHREIAKKSWVAYTFGPTNSYNLILRMSDSTTAVDNEGLLPFETDNPNKIGYDNDNTDEKDNVEYSIYQYTPNNGKNYRYNSFVWTDPVHNAIKIENKDSDIKIKLAQTNQELPKSYYNITIDPNVNVPAVPADFENGVEAELASVRDVIRVEFTEQFMKDQAMYGAMLVMDIKGVLNKENPVALRETYSAIEQAFVIPNRSELHYTDTIATNGAKEKVVSSNTAKVKIKSAEMVQPYVSKTVVNKSAKEDETRPPGAKAKVGDILNYEMEVKNLSIVPTNIWKDVNIYDEIQPYLDIDTSTIKVRKDGITTDHPEYYNASNRKLSLPKQDIAVGESTDLKISFSAKINFSGNGKMIDNWIYADGFDSSNNQLNSSANALLPEQVEENTAPKITLNEKIGESDGTAKKLTGTFKDKESESVTLWYKIDGGSAISISPVYKNNPKNTNLPYEFTISAEDLSYGPHIISVYATDTEGLESKIETLTLDGVLQLVSSPKTLDFGTLTYDAKDQTLENPTYNEQLVVLDSRSNRSEGWHLTATLTKPMMNEKGQELVDALRYVNKGNEKILGEAAASIYENTEGKNDKVVVSSTWGKTEGTDGIKLKVGSSDIVYTGNYTGTITWKLMQGQP